MPIDTSSETLIRLIDARKYLPSTRAGKQLGKAVIFRWASRGCRGVVLESIRIGGGKFTSLQAIQRWLDALNSLEHEQPQSIKSENQRIADQLTAMGV